MLGDAGTSGDISTNFAAHSGLVLVLIMLADTSTAAVLLGTVLVTDSSGFSAALASVSVDYDILHLYIVLGTYSKKMKDCRKLNVVASTKYQLAETRWWIPMFLDM